MTCHSQLELVEKLTKYSDFRDAPVNEGPHSVGVWILKKRNEAMFFYVHCTLCIGCLFVAELFYILQSLNTGIR